MEIKEKKYDCIKEIRKSKERISKDLNGKTTEQILSYFRKRQRKTKSVK